MITSATRFAARRATSDWISTRARMSTALVGSSSTIRRGRVASQRASSTFCWLPPESCSTGVAGSAGLIPSSSMKPATSSSRSARDTGRAQPRRDCRASTMLSRMLRPEITPSPRRSSLAIAMWWRSAAEGERSEIACPSSTALPESATAPPVSSRASSVRPEPRSPAMPTTSPRWRSRSVGASTSRCASCRAL